MKKVTVTLSEQQVSLVLGMIWHCRQNGTFDESEATLVSETNELFMDLEDEIFSQYQL
jgi:hypothetical protein